MNWDSVLICGSGPSLRSIKDPFRLGWPVIAVSTAIRYFPKAHAWVSLDGCQSPHLPEGLAACGDPEVLKVFPRGRSGVIAGMKGQIVNAEWIDCSRPGTFLDGEPGLPHTMGRSMLAAVQWACMTRGATTIVFAGVDLLTDKKDPYAYPEDVPQGIVDRQNGGHAMERDQLRAMAGIASSKGVRFLSWVPDPSPINGFMARFDPASLAVLPGAPAEIHA